jgi:hypothetical protein
MPTLAVVEDLNVFRDRLPGLFPCFIPPVRFWQIPQKWSMAQLTMIFDGGPYILAVFRAALAALRSARPTPCTNRVFSVCRLVFKDSLQQLRGKSGQSSTETLSLLQAAGNPLRW